MTTDPRTALDRLADAFVEDILSMTDEEIIAECIEDGRDPEQVAVEGHRIFERALEQVRRAEMTTYDSRPDTHAHIIRVGDLMQSVINLLTMRAMVHDASKLQEPEKSVFDEYTPKLKTSTYGSDEYKSFLAGMKPALDHHYAVNDHHPDGRGIEGMSLLALVEMLADWKAATERHADGSLAKSLEINRVRFGISDQLHAVLVNTAKELGWL